MGRKRPSSKARGVDWSECVGNRVLGITVRLPPRVAVRKARICESLFHAPTSRGEFDVHSSRRTQALPRFWDVGLLQTSVSGFAREPRDSRLRTGADPSRSARRICQSPEITGKMAQQLEACGFSHANYVRRAVPQPP